MSTLFSVQRIEHLGANPHLLDKLTNAISNFTIGLGGLYGTQIKIMFEAILSSNIIRDIVRLYFWWADYYDCNTAVTSGTSGRAGVKTGLSIASFPTSTYLLLCLFMFQKNVS